ncbi:hypothetical protein HKCCE2091_18000 [Rhodobacterales bacterium HKCCE2091]|nr:hypothetical protein [Rhodobacterales bacterium HKCCE2091]
MSLYRLEDGYKRQAAKRSGKFVLGDPSKGATKHLAENYVMVSDEAEAARLIKEKGFSLWVDPLPIKRHKRPGLVRNGLYRDGLRLT